MSPRALVPVCTGLATCFDNASICGEHDVSAFSIADVVEACCRWKGEGSGGDGSDWSDGPKPCTDSQSYAVCKLRDGRYGVLLESEDYTGHGCQCSGSASVHDTLDDAIRFGLGQSERDDFTAEG